MNKSLENPAKETDRETADFRAQLKDLRTWLAALNRRVEDLEATSFQLVDEEEVILVAVRDTRRLRDGVTGGSRSPMKFTVGRPQTFRPEY